MCENCKNLFDLKTNMPYIIPCGHTICEKCLLSLDFKNNKMKCPIDSFSYEICKDKIPKNEMLIEYIRNFKFGPKYSYQIREYQISEASFCHVDRRNCLQKLCHYLYILIVIKILLRLLNIILWPFRAIYLLFKKIMNLIYIIYIKIKEIIFRIINKFKSIKFPKCINCKYCFKIKNSKLIKAMIKFFKYTVRAPIWINYLKLMKNLLYESQSKVNNKCFKLFNVILALIGIFLAHFIAYLTNNLENFFIILLLLNESTIVLNNFRKMDEEKRTKKLISKNSAKLVDKYNGKRKADFGMGDYIQKMHFDEDDEEYLINKKKHHRGKKCLLRWIGFLLFWYFFPMIKKYLCEFIIYWEYTKNIDFESKEKNVKIWTGVINYLLVFPKLFIVTYLTS